MKFREVLASGLVLVTAKQKLATVSQSMASVEDMWDCPIYHLKNIFEIPAIKTDPETASSGQDVNITA